MEATAPKAPKAPSISSGCAAGTCSNSSFPSGSSYLGNFFHTPSIVLLGDLGSVFPGEGAELNPLPIHPWGSGGDTGHGSHVVGTQGTVVAVGDPVSATDLTQDEGTRSHGLARFGATQVRAAVNLGRQNSSAASASHLHSARSGPLDFRGLCRGKSERF